MGKLNWGMRACAVFLLWGTAAVALPAQTFTTLHSFDGKDGSRPYAGLIQATDGNLYGTTDFGEPHGEGTVFKITPGGTLTKLHSFNYTDGSSPDGGLIQATDGNFYGTTSGGGANQGGEIFKITPSGTLTTFHSFAGTDGSYPDAGLLQATNGDFYGTTSGGGTSNCFGAGCGTVFKITPSGILTTLHSFNGTDGQFPAAALVQATDGSFYGTTEYGGANNNCYSGYGCGTIFKITASGTLTTIYSFCPLYNCADGENPNAGLVQGADGNFYGTTPNGGVNRACPSNNYTCGTVFKITASGMLTTLHSFDLTDGFLPSAGLVQAADGNFYGTTYRGGTNGSCPHGGGCGTLFQITPSGTLTTLYSFCAQSGCADGEYPYAGLVQDTNGKLYGTTSIAGANGNYGTVFSLSVGLGPFAETRPTSGKVGKAVQILGTKLTGATSVTFNGTTATFTVKSKSEITTTVPTGATTGTVQVVTPGGTLSSNEPFRIN
jgi:uncharacterized repeat protein (TIGR03803 family)